MFWQITRQSNVKGLLACVVKVMLVHSFTIAETNDEDPLDLSTGNIIKVLDYIILIDICLMLLYFYISFF